MTALNRTPLFLRKQPGGIDAIVNESMTTGNIFWVHNSGSTTGGYSPSAPASTVNGAVALCTANQGDVVFIMPGHTENISTASGCSLSKTGIKVIGLGHGLDRPQLILTAAAATIGLAAQSTHLENVLITSNFLNIVSAVTISYSGCTLKDVEMKDTSPILGALIQVTIATACSDVTIDGLLVRENVTLTAAATNTILAAGTHDKLTIKNTRIYAFTTAAAVALSAGIGLGITLENIRLTQAETGAGLGIACHNSSTGLAEDITVVNLRDAVKGLTGTGLSIGARVNYSNAVNKYAGLFSYAIDS